MLPMQHIAPMTPAAIPPSALPPVEECCYCWYVLHPTVVYPAERSSTICAGHSAWILDQHAQLRAARQAEQEAA